MASVDDQAKIVEILFKLSAREMSSFFTKVICKNSHAMNNGVFSGVINITRAETIFRL